MLLSMGVKTLISLSSTLADENGFLFFFNSLYKIFNPGKKTPLVDCHDVRTGQVNLLARMADFSCRHLRASKPGPGLVLELNSSASPSENRWRSLISSPACSVFAPC